METVHSPYSADIPEDAKDSRVPELATPKIAGEGVPAPEVLKAAIDRFTGAADRIEAAVEQGKKDGVVVGSSRFDADATPGQTADDTKHQASAEQIMAKCLAFLDNNLMSPMTVLGPVRHKLFVFRIPSQQELIDVAAFAGTLVRDPDAPIPAAEQTLNIIGELQKACAGYLFEKSPDIGVLRQNIANPKKWPTLLEPNWLNSRDPYIIAGEVYPLWQAYQNWRAEVVPTVAELDFFYANQR